MKRPANQDADRGHTRVTTTSTSPEPFSEPDSFLKSESSADSESFPRDPDASDAPIVLEILRGRTDFPIRPLASSEFLIGGGCDCDLRLGGALPEFHSLIRWDGAELSIVALAEQPPILVGGEPVERAVLTNGDCVRIGSIEFRVHQRKVLTECPLSDVDDGGLSALSASALVDLLEADLNLIAECESDQRRARQLLEPSFGEERVGELSGELPAAVSDRLERLANLSCELDARERELQQREKECAEAARFLIEAQRTLAKQLQQLQSSADTPVSGSDLSAA